MRSSPAGVQRAPSKSPVRFRLRRLAVICGYGLLFAYVAAVTAGYLWLRYGRKIDQVRAVDVAFFRVESVRRAIGRQHYVRAQEETAAKNYQAAYLSYASALRQDPDNIPGRLEAAEFFRKVGAVNQSIIILEEGLARQPDDSRLIKAALGYLLSSGRDRHALDLIRQRYGRDYSGENAPLLRTYEIRATLNTAGVEAAKQLLQQHPELRGFAPVAPVLARVLWESSERLRAIGLLNQHLGSEEAVYDDYAQLATWQAAGGMAEEAIRTAQQACQKYPESVAARVLLIEIQAGAAGAGGPAQAEVAAYLRDFAGGEEAISRLSSAAGRKGWVGLTRMLYELAALTRADLGLLALNHADALARKSRFEELWQVLDQIEAQAADNAGAAFMLQLRMRQVIAAGALKKPDNVREYARRLATLVRNDPDRLESYRQFFRKSGLAEAVAEFSQYDAPSKPGQVPAATGT